MIYSEIIHFNPPNPSFFKIIFKKLEILTTWIDSISSVGIDLSRDLKVVTTLASIVIIPKVRLSTPTKLTQEIIGMGKYSFLIDNTFGAMIIISSRDSKEDVMEVMLLWT